MSIAEAMTYMVYFFALTLHQKKRITQFFSMSIADIQWPILLYLTVYTSAACDTSLCV